MYGVEVGDVKDRVCVLLDDMSDSCGTLCKVRGRRRRRTEMEKRPSDDKDGEEEGKEEIQTGDEGRSC